MEGSIHEVLSLQNPSHEFVHSAFIPLLFYCTDDPDLELRTLGEYLYKTRLNWLEKDTDSVRCSTKPFL